MSNPKDDPILIRCPACHYFKEFTKEQLSSESLLYIETCKKCGCYYDPRKAVRWEWGIDRD